MTGCGRALGACVWSARGVCRAAPLRCAGLCKLPRAPGAEASRPAPRPPVQAKLGVPASVAIAGVGGRSGSAALGLDSEYTRCATSTPYKLCRSMRATSCPCSFLLNSSTSVGGWAGEARGQ